MFDSLSGCDEKKIVPRRRNQYVQIAKIYLVPQSQKYQTGQKLMT